MHIKCTSDPTENGFGKSHQTPVLTRSAAPWKCRAALAGPRSGPEIFSTEVAVWEHRRGEGGGRAYQLYGIIWRFLHTRTSRRPRPTGQRINNAQSTNGDGGHGRDAPQPNPISR
jgi:hypothetical protein